MNALVLISVIPAHAEGRGPWAAEALEEDIDVDIEVDVD